MLHIEAHISILKNEKIKKKSVQYLENEPLNVLELIVDINWWIEISFLNIFWQKNIFF